MVSQTTPNIWAYADLEWIKICPEGLQVAQKLSGWVYESIVGPEYKKQFFPFKITKAYIANILYSITSWSPKCVLLGL